MTTSPHSPVAEAAVIGAVLLDPAQAGDAVAALQVDDFYLPNNRRYWDAILGLKREGKPIDVVLVGEASGVAPAVYAEELFKAVHETPVSGNAKHYAEQLQRLSARRQAIATCGELQHELAQDDSDSEHQIALAQRKLAEIRFGGPGSRDDLISSLLRANDEIEARRGGKRTGIRTGLGSLDEVTGGFRSGQLVIVAAKTSLGKTALAVQTAVAAARAKHPVMFCSLEMATAELIERMYSHLGRIDLGRIGAGELEPKDWEALHSAAAQIGKYKLTVEDRAKDLGKLEAACRQWRALNPDGQGLIVLDYLQLVGVKKQERREREVAEVSRTFKLLAGELGCTCIALSQLNRQSDQENRPPRLADLRESGAIEQDADMVIFIHRERGENEDCSAKIILEKNRSGRTGGVDVRWVGRFQTFHGIARNPGGNEL